MAAVPCRPAAPAASRRRGRLGLTNRRSPSATSFRADPVRLGDEMPATLGDEGDRRGDPARLDRTSRRARRGPQRQLALRAHPEPGAGQPHSRRRAALRLLPQVCRGQSGRDNCCPIFLACIRMLLCFSYPIFCHKRTLAVTGGDGSLSKGVVTGFSTPFGPAGVP